VFSPPALGVSFFTIDTLGSIGNRRLGRTHATAQAQAFFSASLERFGISLSSLITHCDDVDADAYVVLNTLKSSTYSLHIGSDRCFDCDLLTQHTQHADILTQRSRLAHFLTQLNTYPD
jgi:hypothetical protein